MKRRLEGLAAIASVLFFVGLWGLVAVPALAQDAAPAVAPVQDVAPATASVPDEWLQDLAVWRKQREGELSAPDGWLTLAGLEWLKPGVNSVGAAADNQIKVQGPDHIGLLTVSGDLPSGKIIQLLAPKDGFPADLKVDGYPALEGPLAVKGANQSTITWGGLTLVVIGRGGRYLLRVKDANSPTRTGFHGLNWYAPNPNFRVPALWIPFVPERIEKIPTVLGTTLDLPSPGVAEFMLDGKLLRLEPVIEAGEKDKLFFILRDETSKTTTYETARFLHTGLPNNGLDQKGVLMLDFNRLENPPCAYTPYATCPLPPEQNRLPVALEAGEQRYAP